MLPKGSLLFPPVPFNIRKRLTIEENNELNEFIHNTLVDYGSRYAAAYPRNVVGNDEERNLTPEDRDYDDGSQDRKDLLHLFFIVCFVVACIFGALCLVNCVNSVPRPPLLN